MSTDIDRETLKIARTISEYYEGSVNHVEFFRSAARLFYNNENNMQEINRQLSSPGIRRNSESFVWDTRGQPFQSERRQSALEVQSGGRARARSINTYIEADNMVDGCESVDGGYDIPDAGFDMPDGSFEIADDVPDSGYKRQGTSSIEDEFDSYDIPDAGFVMPDGGYDIADGIGYTDSNIHSTVHEDLEESVDDDDPIPFLRGASLQFFSEDDDAEDQCDGLVQTDGVWMGKPKKSYRRVLENSEQEVMKAFKQKMKVLDVAIGGGVFIHTVRVCCNPDICCNSASPKIPLVMVHGIGGAIPAFYKNYENLAIDRCVYGIDMPGFGLSERKVQFPNDPNACEHKMVDMIDRWREEMNIDKMILLGHSFGGYVSAAYVLRYHKHVHHLVLLDPWGVFSKEDDNYKKSEKLLEKIAKKVCEKLGKNPFAMFSSLGEMIGKAVLRLFLDAKVQKIYGQTCIDYLIKLSLTGEQTGAKAFTVISNYTFCYPERPLKERLINLLKNDNHDLQITFLYGEESSFYKSGNICAREVEKASPTVKVQCVKGAEHHIQVQKPEEMVDYILKCVYPGCRDESSYDDN